MILLMRGDVGYDKVRYNIYRDQVLIRVIDKFRSESRSNWSSLPTTSFRNAIGIRISNVVPIFKSSPFRPIHKI